MSSSPRQTLELPSSLLFWLSGALGDTLLAYPALGALRRWAPSCTITAVGRPSFLWFAERLGLVNRIEDVDGPLAGALLAGAAPRSFTPPQCAVIYSAAYEQLASYLRTLAVPLLIGSPPRSADGRHQTRYLLDCLYPLGVDRRLLPSTLAASSLPSPHGIDLGPADRPLVLLHPGAGARWKRWPQARYLALAEALCREGVTVRWSYGPADEDPRAALPASIAGSAALLPPLDLHTFAAVLARCGVVVTPDTGVAHLAALLDVPQVTLFGPTDPQRWRPVSRKAIILRASDRCGGDWQLLDPGPPGIPSLALCRCRPFLPTACRCLAALEMEPVLAACHTLLAQSERAPRPADT
ncbi:MAG TPA: glycosyltransferase family 9 protein [Chloroflexota bacterium]|nr:glycosyltransferase family 9 protein [Chloroflexota bacterium]